MMNRTLRIGWALLALIPVLITGCVEGRVITFVRYERSDDSFRCMQIYTNLHAIDQKDLDHMEALWNRRHSMIINPDDLNPFEFRLFSTVAIERKGRNKFCTVDLGSPRSKEAEAKVTQVDLDTIRVIPGEFYFNSHGNLSYYHQCVVPGKTLDAIIEEVTPSLVEWMAKLADEQIQLAGKEKVRRLTWDDVRKEFLDQMAEKDNPKPKPRKAKEGEELLPLEMASLRLLIKAGADKSVKCSRTRDVFTMVVPVTKQDGHEAVATVDLIRNTIADRIKAGKTVEEGLPQTVEAIKVRFVEGAGLEVTVDISKLAKTGKVDVNPQPDEKKKVGYNTTVLSFQVRGIPINKTFSIDKLIAEYTGR